MVLRSMGQNPTDQVTGQMMIIIHDESYCSHFIMQLKIMMMTLTKYDKQELKEMIGEMDEDDSGTVDFEE